MIQHNPILVYKMPMSSIDEANYKGILAVCKTVVVSCVWLGLGLSALITQHAPSTDFVGGCVAATWVALYLWE